MFCPECRTEYRPGFKRCPDCEVDLVSELPLSPPGARTKRDWMSRSTAYKEGRKTVHWWVLYKQRTGSWPWLSIAIHFTHWVVILCGGGILIWWFIEHHVSRWQFLGTFLLVSVPYGIVENWAKRRMKLHCLRNRNRLTRSQK